MSTKAPRHRGPSCRENLLQAALRKFALRGYAGASIQEIVDEARVTKPALYYHFPSKEKLYSALVDHAHDERFRIMQEGAARCGNTEDRLTAIVRGVFEFAQQNQELMRLTMATAFAAPEEIPPSVKNLAKGKRNLEFLCQVMREGQQAGELTMAYDAEALAFGVFGQVNAYTMVNLLFPGCHLDARLAARVVGLFLDGARTRPPGRRRIAA